MKSLSSEINELDFQVKTAQIQKAKVLYGAPTDEENDDLQYQLWLLFSNKL